VYCRPRLSSARMRADDHSATVADCAARPVWGQHGVPVYSRSRRAARFTTRRRARVERFVAASRSDVVPHLRRSRPSRRLRGRRGRSSAFRGVPFCKLRRRRDARRGFGQSGSRDSLGARPPPSRSEFDAKSVSRRASPCKRTSPAAKQDSRCPSPAAGRCSRPPQQDARAGNDGSGCVVGRIRSARRARRCSESASARSRDLSACSHIQRSRRPERLSSKSNRARENHSGREIALGSSAS